MNSGKVIGFDIDGVLADFVGPASQLLHELYEIRPRSSGSQLTWHFPITEEQEQTMWEAIDATNGRFWRHLKPLVTDSELDEMWALERDGYAFCYVTSRHRKARQATMEWLVEQQFPIGKLHMVKDKASYLSQQLPSALDELDLAGFLDDSPQHARELAARGLPNYIRDFPYNRGMGVPGIRVSSVGEYLFLVTGGETPRLSVMHND